MHFGEPLDDERLATLLRPGNGVDTIITADVYGKGAADLAVGRALGRGLLGGCGGHRQQGQRQQQRGEESSCGYRRSHLDRAVPGP